MMTILYAIASFLLGWVIGRYVCTKSAIESKANEKSRQYEERVREALRKSLKMLDD